MPVATLYSRPAQKSGNKLQLRKSSGSITACELFREKKLVLVGVSLGNSYFTQERLGFILSVLSANFQQVAVLLADALSIHNYRAMGHVEAKAKKKLRKDSNLAYNRIQRAIEYAHEQQAKKNISLYQWKEIEASASYQTSLQTITALYDSNPDFASEINNSTLDVMRKYLSDTNTEDAIVNEAKWYFLKELAFVHSASDFFNSSVLTSYYTDLPIFGKLLSFGCLHEDKKNSAIIYECGMD